MDIELLYKKYKALLFSLAYRMLGSVMDAEDIVQDAFLTFNQLPDAEKMENKRAYLCKMVTNRCLDLLRSSAKKRELYVGPWLPEPLLDQEELDDPSASYLKKESLSTAYLLLLQQLNAMERAVFLLREIFQYSYEEIAEMVEKSSANCRQIFRRAKQSIHFDPAILPDVSTMEAKVKDFVQSILHGNTTHLMELIREDVICYNDGGGKVRAAQVPIKGFSNVIHVLSKFARMYSGQYTMRYANVNLLPGLIFTMDNGDRYVYSFEFRGSEIKTIYAVVNPDKLAHIV
ncbi:RNA polymerase sigma-70 factor [Shimazuella sp. AN120528]|uniref:RNA polymerase sigma-70 factor n=1 Tax=Shimazuella soli TaxID=1892854 RepID=UPI001F0F90FD|nr:RNA polymerase sigma-70 factor [Shimazuella soli]MCH5586108.1 RNA polymerase sigma-70 factor [Shimazuella soli]